MKMVVGLTGGIGSGKSTVAKLFKKQGIEVIDADQVAREVVAPGENALQEIESYFGKDILDQNGALKRDLLREIIFNCESKKLWLNNLLHPIIRQRMLDKLSACCSPYAILEAPLLFENELNQYTTYDVVVDVPEKIQLQRAMQRDNSSQTQIEAIIKSQISRAKRLQRSDFVIDNSSTNMALLAEQVQSLHNKLLSKL